MTAFSRFAAIPRQQYRVIYADPPWSFRTYSDNGKGRSPEQHYECMTPEDIQALPVAELGHPEGSALCLWVTDPCLKEGLACMEAWGFTYKTVLLTWAKLNKSWTPTVIGSSVAGLVTMDEYTPEDFFTGMGYYTRKNPEMCLLGTRGVVQRLHRDVRQLIVAPRREHSRKPEQAYERLERLLPGPRIELFGRTAREGWDVWGNQTSHFASQRQSD